MKHVYVNGSWYKGSMRYGLRHGYGCYNVPYDDITLLGIWKWDRFQFGIASHGHQTRVGFGHELYKGILLNRISHVHELNRIHIVRKRKSKKRLK